MIGSFEQFPRLKHVNGVHCVIKFISQFSPVMLVGHKHLNTGSVPNMLVITHVPPFKQGEFMHGFLNSHRKPVKLALHEQTAVVNEV